MPTRRDLLLGLGAALALPGLSLARTPTDRRLVVVLLRGALDGLAAVPPHGDPRHTSVRGDAAVAEGVVDLNGHFGLHPSLAPWLPLWTAGELGIVHAVGNPRLDRSHFDAQNCLENGTDRPFGVDSGWLNRALSVDGEPALAVGRTVPWILRGPGPVTSADPLRRWAPDATFVSEVAELYRGDPLLGPALDRAMATRAMLEPHRQRAARPGDLEQAAAVIGGVLADPRGPRVAVFEADGWDTHTRQANRLSQLLGGLADGVLALKQGLGEAWSSTAVVVLTEFGRTVAGNGTGGTDHGTGSVVFLAGGAVAGGLHGTWPGLGTLYEDRDLMPANDVRGILKGVAGDHLGVPEGALEDRVFPDSRNVARIQGLIRS